MVETDRIEGILKRQGERFLERIYTSAEREYCGRNLQCLAARFAGKEAVLKALGTGLTQGCTFQDISILRDESGKPYLVLEGRVREIALEKGMSSWLISLSHTKHYALAYVVSGR